jgi:hypothetical protein
MKRWSVLCLAVIGAAALFAWNTEALKRVPLDPKTLPGPWFGSSADGLYLYRIQLDESGHGQIGSAYRDDSLCVLPIKAWAYDRGQINLALGEPLGACNDGASFTLSARGSELELRERGKDWRIDVVLRREDVLLRRLHRLQDSMVSQK